jgi:choline-sulfatase
MRVRWIVLAGVIACSAPAKVQPPPHEAAAPTLAPVAGPVPSGAASAEPVTQPMGHAPSKLNVLVISIDALRADMPWAGYPRDIAPNLTALEKQAVSYTRAYSLSSYTAMSLAGLLSGRYPSELDRNGFFFSMYPDGVEMFPELLQKAGVRTLGGMAHFYFEKKAGFHQGFDDWRMVDGITVNNKTDESITSPQHLELAKAMLSDPKNTREPFFAWFHFMDPHDKYRSHPGFPEFGVGGGRDRYDGEVYFTDHHVGKLLEFVRAQPWAARTAIVVTSDHGEAFGEHDRTRHGFEIWEPLVRVPLFVVMPGVAPRRIDVPRSAIDLAPTFCELLGVAPSPAFQGKSLVAEIRGEEQPEERDVVVDLPRTSDNWRRRALVRGNYKITAYDDDFKFELYDLVTDPKELVDLRRKDPQTFDAMKKRYKERVQTIHEVCPTRTDILKGKRPEKPC